MTLAAVRRKFIEFTGRYDLVTDIESYLDNGANFFIQSGQKWLDRYADIFQSRAISFHTIAVGGWYVLIPNIRAIENVWFSNADGEKWQLEKVELATLKTEFGGDPADFANSCRSLIYAPTTLRVSPEVVGTITLDHFGTTIYSDATKSHWGYQGLVFLPPTDSVITLEVHGLFYQPLLTLDASQNFWSEEQPFILVLAAARALEISYRNSAGVRDWEEAIASEVRGLEFDLVAQESAGYTQMEG